jgi:membrane protease YdiL (CAAX protease family)
MAAGLALVPLLGMGLWQNGMRRFVRQLPPLARLLFPAVFVLPYLLVTLPRHCFHIWWFLLYTELPVAVGLLLALAAHLDPEQKGHWLDATVLLSLGLAADLRWFEAAWPPRLVAMNKLLLLDAGLYGFHLVRCLHGTGLDLRWRLSDWKTGIREFCFYAPMAILMGLAIGFLHLHRQPERPWLLPLAWIYTYLLIALPEEIFFRGWIQNLLERRTGRTTALMLTAVLFGLSHFNKRAAHFNWRYVLLAALAGVFYGRAWRARRRIPASAITHTLVDAVWGASLQ